MPFVLAESAQQLYRDTNYSDLITFEEDIARISSIVLVISESAGSLAELGAFSSNETIRDTLRILIQESHANEESFVRYGPIERVQNISRDRVGVFPWKTHKKGGLVKASAAPHYATINKFIVDHVYAQPKSHAYAGLGASAAFFDILWLTHLSSAISPTLLYDYVRKVHPSLSDGEIRNLLYCMKVVGWIGQVSYGGKDYFYCQQDSDPFEYAFNAGVSVTDSSRRKLNVSKFIRAEEELPRAVYQRVIDAQKSAIV